MNNVEIELNSPGIADLLRSPEMKAICKEQADNVARRCGEGYEVDTYVGKGRVNAMVYASTKEAVRDNYRNNTLLKALGG